MCTHNGLSKVTAFRKCFRAGGKKSFCDRLLADREHTIRKRVIHREHKSSVMPCSPDLPRTTECLIQKKKFDYSPTSLETPKGQRSFRQRRERVLKVIECAKRTSGLSAETAHIERPGSVGRCEEINRFPFDRF